MTGVSYLKFQDATTFPLRIWELIWYSVILLTGALGNLLVCLVICKSSSVFRSTPFNMYLCSLAVADMLVALIGLPNYVLSTPVFNHPGGIWGDVMCKTITGNFLTFYVSGVSAYSLVLISLERLQAVHKFPINTSCNPTRRRRVWISIVAAWLIPFIVQCPEPFYLLMYKRERRAVIGNYCTYVWGREPGLRTKIYGAVILATEGLVPLLIFIFSFYNIRKCLLKEEKRVSGQARGTTFSEGYRYYICWQIMEKRHRTVKVLMIAAGVFMVCWIPNKIMFFMINYTGQKHTSLTWNSPLYQIGILIGFTGSCINPFLYAFQSREFRKHSKRALKSLLPESFKDNFGYCQIESSRNRNRNVAESTIITKQAERERHVDTTTTAGRSILCDTSRAVTRTPQINVVI